MGIGNNKDRSARRHAATGIEFVYAGELSFGNPALGATGAFNDVAAYRCSRCYALIVELDGEQARHAEQHALVERTHEGLLVAMEKLDRVDMKLRETMISLRDTTEKIDCLAPGAFQPLPATQASMPAADMRRGAERAAKWRNAAVLPMSKDATIPTAQLDDVEPAPVADAAAWTDTATVREVPPTPSGDAS